MPLALHEAASTDSLLSVFAVNDSIGAIYHAHARTGVRTHARTHAHAHARVEAPSDESCCSILYSAASSARQFEKRLFSSIGTDSELEGCPLGQAGWMDGWMDGGMDGWMDDSTQLRRAWLMNCM